MFKNKKIKDEEYDDEEFEEDELEENRSYQKRIIKKKDFRDLKSENRKNRKEPEKPWGRKERFIVLSLLIITTGISGFLALSARDYKLPGFPRLKIPQIVMPQIFKKETIIIEGNKGDKVKADMVIDQFHSKVNNLSGTYGLYVTRLGNGYSYGVNETEVFQAASLIKLPIMAALYLEAENGELNLEQKYTLKNSDKVAGAGSLSGKSAGYQITYRNLIRLMGKESDNSAFRITRNLLGEGKIMEVITALGMKNTNLAKNQTTAKDIGNFFVELWYGNVLNEENKNELLGFLTDTVYEDWLPAGIPDDIKVSHKYGREVHVVNDAGIIHGDNSPYVAVILSKGVIEKEADAIFPELSRMIFEAEK